MGAVEAAPLDGGVNWIKRKALRFWLRRKEKGEMGERFKAAVGWLADPAHPGRKRGVAAIAGALSAALRVYGQHEAAEMTEGVNEMVQTVVVPGLDLTAFVFAIVGVGDAVRRKRIGDDYMARKAARLKG